MRVQACLDALQSNLGVNESALPGRGLRKSRGSRFYGATVLMKSKFSFKQERIVEGKEQVDIKDYRNILFGVSEKCWDRD